MSRISLSLSHLAVRHRRLLLLLAAAIGAWSAWAAEGVEFDRSLENMFAADNPVLPPFARLKRTFSAGDVILAAYGDDQLMTPEGIARSEQTAAALAAAPGVSTVVGVHSFVGRAIASPFNPIAGQLRETFAGFTHSRDGRTAAFLCMLDHGADHTAAVDDLRAIVGQRGGVIAGEPVMIVDGFRYLEADGRRLGWISTVALALVILWCFRSVRWLVVPMAVVLWTRWVTQAALVAAGLRLTIVSSMLTALVTVVAVAAVMHVIVRFQEARAAGRPPKLAMRATLVLLAAPVFWSCLTDALGFASLLISGVEPVRDFGLMTATGAALVFVAIAIVVPGLALAGRWDADPKRAWGQERLDAGLAESLRFVDRHPRLVAGAALVVAALLIAGVWRLEVETDFTKNFRASSPVVASYDFIESRLGGAGVWDLVLPAPPRLTPEFLARARRCEERLRRELGGAPAGGEGHSGGAPPGCVTAQLSLLDIADAIPLGNALIAGRAMETVHRFHPLAHTLYNVDPQSPGDAYYRVMLRAAERQPAADKDRLIGEVQRIADEEFPPSSHSRRPEVTGYFILLARLIDSVQSDQWRMFFLSTLAIGVCVLIAFGKAGLMAAALAANLLPILIALGLWGWLGLRVNLGTAMIAAIAMGLSIDSSIHYLADYTRQRRAGHNLPQALALAQRAAGRAMTFATAALVVGFLALIPSNFIPTVYFGALSALALGGGLLSNLVALPLLVRWLDRRRDR